MNFNLVEIYTNRIFSTLQYFLVVKIIELFYHILNVCPQVPLPEIYKSLLSDGQDINLTVFLKSARGDQNIDYPHPYQVYISDVISVLRCSS